jgi:hypothetical protein
MITSYRFFLHSKEGMIPADESIFVDSDIEARDIAVKMLRDRPLIDWIEVWRDADLVFRLNRHEIVDRHR